jgi:hypothetical protein
MKLRNKHMNEFKGNTKKQLNEIRKTMCDIKEEFNRGRNCEKNQNEIVEMKSSISQKPQLKAPINWIK